MKITFTADAALGGVANKIAQNAEKAEHILALQIRKDTSPYVPATTLTLDRTTKVDGGEIIYPGPMSQYLYYGKLMVDPDTGSAFAQKGASKILTDRNLVFNKTVHPQAQSHWFEASKAQNLDKWLRVARKAVTNG